MEKPHNEMNDFPQEKVRSAIRQGIAQADAHISNGMNRTHKNKSKKRKLFYTVSSVAAGFAILIGSSYYSPALASNLSQLPIIGSVFKDSNLIGLQKAQEKGLADEIEETETINGISVTLNEILYDQNNITIGLQIKSEKKLDQFYFGAGMASTIDGKNARVSSGAYGEDIQSPHVRTALQTITVTEDMPDAFELGLTLNGKNEEQWSFSIPVKQIKHISKIPIQHSESVRGIDLTVTELYLSDTGTGLSYESSEQGNDFQLSRAGNIEFRIVDQDGNEIMSHSGGATGTLFKDRMVFKSDKQFDPIDEWVTELTITPYLALPTDGGGVEVDANGESRELPFKGTDLQPVEFESFKVKIPN